MINLIILMSFAGEYVIDDADHDGAILFRFLSTRFREKAAQSSQGSYGSKPVHGRNTGAGGVSRLAKHACPDGVRRRHKIFLRALRAHIGNEKPIS